MDARLEEHIKHEIRKFKSSYGSFNLESYSDIEDKTVILTALFVEEQYRGKGHGNKLLEDAECAAKWYNFESICLKVDRSDWKEEWYKRHGYTFLEIEKDDDCEYVWLIKYLYG
jgi:GNAT superfamily N-acetyltransferase